MRPTVDLPPGPIVTGYHATAMDIRVSRPDGLPWWLLHYTMDGTAWFETASGRLRAGAGDLVLISPGTAQRYGVEQGDSWRVLWHGFERKPGFERWLLGWPEAAPGHRRLRLDDSDPAHRGIVEDCLWKAHRLAVGGAPNGRWLALNALEAGLIRIDAANPLSPAPPSDSRLRRVIDHIHGRLDRAICMTELAAVAAVSIPQLGRLFRSAFQQTPMGYVEAARIARAKELLELSPLSVQAISWEVGFATPCYFSTRFRQFTGLSPSEFRRIASASPPEAVESGSEE